MTEGSGVQLFRGARVVNAAGSGNQAPAGR
jgi:hypothetical protein